MKTTFKKLLIGEKFEFANHYPGMASGPWVKISPRKYVIWLAKNQKYTYQVGNWNVEVEKQ